MIVRRAVRGRQFEKAHRCEPDNRWCIGSFWDSVVFGYSLGVDCYQSFIFKFNPNSNRMIISCNTQLKGDFIRKVYRLS